MSTSLSSSATSYSHKSPQLTCRYVTSFNDHPSLPNTGSMAGQRRRRWLAIDPVLAVLHSPTAISRILRLGKTAIDGSLIGRSSICTPPPPVLECYLWRHMDCPLIPLVLYLSGSDGSASLMITSNDVHPQSRARININCGNLRGFCLWLYISQTGCTSTSHPFIAEVRHDQKAVTAHF